MPLERTLIMSEENENASQVKDVPQIERVGDLLRKERITRRIALETIAKDLKLNVKYVRSLEANDYNDLPADPYIRVYLRSLAKYLLLDPDAILKKFYEERGIHDDKFRKGSDTQIMITMVKNHKKKNIKPWMIVLIIIIALAILSFFAQKMRGGDTGASDGKTNGNSSSDTQQTSLAKPIATDSIEDSFIGGMIPHDSVIAGPTDTVKPTAKALDSLEHAKGTLSFEIKAQGDSVWVQVFSDGVSWKNCLKPNQTKRCFARDSFNVHVGNNSKLLYTFNGKPFRLEARDVAIFKLDRVLKYPEIWTLAHWNIVFKSRT
jgi:cytoskeletal protein RodZ